MDRIPDCPLDSLRSFLDSIGFHKSESLSDDEFEWWLDEGDQNYAYFPIERDAVTFNVAAVITNQVGRAVTDIPFYDNLFPPGYPGY